MRRLNTGDPCPCCLQPIRLTDSSALEILTQMCDMLGLPDLRESEEYEPVGVSLSPFARQTLRKLIDDGYKYVAADKTGAVRAYDAEPFREGPYWGATGFGLTPRLEVDIPVEYEDGPVLISTLL